MTLWLSAWLSLAHALLDDAAILESPEWLFMIFTAYVLLWINLNMRLAWLPMYYYRRIEVAWTHIRLAILWWICVWYGNLIEWLLPMRQRFVALSAHCPQTGTIVAIMACDLWILYEKCTDQWMVTARLGNFVLAGSAHSLRGILIDELCILFGCTQFVNAVWSEPWQG